MYRIFSVNFEGIKVVKNEYSLEDKWDDNSRNNDNNTYCKTAVYCNLFASLDKVYQNGVILPNITNGEKTGTVNDDSYVYNYLTQTFYNTLSEDTKNKIVISTFNIGPVNTTNSSVIEAANNEKIWTTNAKVGLITASEYANGQLPSSSGYTSCQTNLFENGDCKADNYLYHPSTNIWLLTPPLSNADSICSISGASGLLTTRTAYITRAIFPAFTLDGNITLEGNGTELDPYTIVS